MGEQRRQGDAPLADCRRWPAVRGSEAARAQALGLSVQGLNRLRSLVEERGRNAWAVGDVLVTVYGAPPPAGVMDGSRQRLAALADLLGCSASWLIACRLTSAAWPGRERRASVAWTCHRDLRARPDRYGVLAAFVDACSRQGLTPSAGRLDAWLDQRHDDRGERDGHDVPAGPGEQFTRPPQGVGPTVGRPRLDPVERLARQALALDRADLERLVTRLQVELAAIAAAA